MREIKIMPEWHKSNDFFGRNASQQASNNLYNCGDLRNEQLLDYIKDCIAINRVALKLMGMGAIGVVAPIFLSQGLSVMSMGTLLISAGYFARGFALHYLSSHISERIVSMGRKRDFYIKTQWYMHEKEDGFTFKRPDY